MPLIALSLLLAAAPLGCKAKLAPPAPAARPDDAPAPATATAARPGPAAPETKEKPTAPAVETQAAPAPPPAPEPAPAAPPGAPEWASAQVAAHPQPAAPAEIYDALRLARTAGEKLGDVLLICRAHAVGKFDAFRGPDITVNVTVGSARPVIIHGPENTYTAYITLRLPSLARGTRLTLSAYDRDATGREHIGSLVLTYAGSFPLREEIPHLQVECRAALPDTADALMSDEARKTKGMLARAPGALKPTPGAQEWGLLRSPIPGLRVQIAGEAALIGWADARVRAHLGELAGVEKRWDELAAAAVSASAAALPERGAEVSLSVMPASVRVTSAACAAPETCQVTLAFKNTGEANVRCSSFNSWVGKIKRLALVGPTGRMSPLRLAECTSRDKRKVTSLAPGDEATLVLKPARPRKNVRAPSPVGARLLWLADFIMRRHDLLKI